MLESVKQENISTNRKFGSESDVAALTGIAKRTLQKDRLFGKGFPFYRHGRRILYDLSEVESMIRAQRVGAQQ